MAAMSVVSEWNVSFTTPELRLVLKALGGRLKPEEIDEAKLLGDRLTKMREQASQKAIKDADRLLEAIEVKAT